LRGGGLPTPPSRSSGAGKPSAARSSIAPSASPPQVSNAHPSCFGVVRIGIRLPRLLDGIELSSIHVTCERRGNSWPSRRSASRLGPSSTRSSRESTNGCTRRGSRVHGQCCGRRFSWQDWNRRNIRVGPQAGFYHSFEIRSRGNSESSIRRSAC